MTKDEALTVLNIMSTADGECSVCVRELFQQFFERFPKIKVSDEDISKITDGSFESMQDVYPEEVKRERPKKS